MCYPLNFKTTMARLAVIVIVTLLTWMSVVADDAVVLKIKGKEYDGVLQRDLWFKGDTTIQLTTEDAHNLVNPEGTPKFSFTDAEVVMKNEPTKKFTVTEFVGMNGYIVKEVK